MWSPWASSTYPRVFSAKGWGKGKQPHYNGGWHVAPKQDWTPCCSADQGWVMQTRHVCGQRAAAVGATDCSSRATSSKNAINAKGKGKDGSSKGQLRNFKEPCRPDTEQDLETDTNPEDENWNKYSASGGPSTHAMTDTKHAQKDPGGYGSHNAFDANMTSFGHKRDLKAGPSDEDIQQLLKRTRLAETKSDAAKTELEADQAEQLPRPQTIAAHSLTVSTASPVSSPHLSTPTSESAEITPKRYHRPAGAAGASMPSSLAGSTGKPLHNHAGSIKPYKYNMPGAPAGISQSVADALCEHTQILAGKKDAAAGVAADTWKKHTQMWPRDVAAPSHEEHAAENRIRARAFQILAERQKAKCEKEALTAAAAEQKRQADEEAVAMGHAEAMETEDRMET